MWPNPQVTADLVTFTEEIFNEKLHFLCSDSILSHANHNYANNSSWFIKTDDNITLFWTVFGFGKWFSYFNWERLAYVFSKKKLWKTFWAYDVFLKFQMRILLQQYVYGMNSLKLFLMKQEINMKETTLIYWSH